MYTQEYREKFFESCRVFAKAMAPVEKGPYFHGSSFTMVDIAFAPFWQRFVWVGGYYRDLEFPKNDEAFDRLDR